MGNYGDKIVAGRVGTAMGGMSTGGSDGTTFGTGNREGTGAGKSEGTGTTGGMIGLEPEAGATS